MPRLRPHSYQGRRRRQPSHLVPGVLRPPPCGGSPVGPRDGEAAVGRYRHGLVGQPARSTSPNHPPCTAESLPRRRPNRRLLINDDWAPTGRRVRPVLAGCRISWPALGQTLDRQDAPGDSRAARLSGAEMTSGAKQQTRRAQGRVFGRPPVAGTGGLRSEVKAKHPARGPPRASAPGLEDRFPLCGPPDCRRRWT
jgi:hypothetical protein